MKTRHLPTLTFLPANEIPGVFHEIKLHWSEEANEVKKTIICMVG
jgi:hypothetical protein